MDMHFEGVVFSSHAAEVARRIERPWPPFAVVDVRPAADFERRRIDGSISFDPDGEAALPPGTTAATEFLVVGSGPEDAGVRKASLLLRQGGARRVVEVPGGIFEWRQLGLPLVSGDRRAA